MYFLLPSYTYSSGGNLQGLGSSRSSTAFTDGGDSEAAVSNLIWIKLLSFLKNLVFVLALISLVCLTLIQGIQCVNKFLASPTYISTEVVDQFEAEFPAMTICPSGYRLDVLKSYGYGSVRKYNYHSKCGALKP